MNRHQRRQSARTEKSSGAAAIPEKSFFPQNASSPKPTGKPSLMLRFFASIILSSWVRKRVRHPAARAAMALVAHEVGRHDLATELEN
jgi:hypothetical protein